ncbi:RNA polymerase sigma factor [Micromonospora sp. NPDC003197]
MALRDEVHRALDTLSERDREVLVTAAWFDLTPAQAAQVLGISRLAYAVRLHRARHRFRTAYERSTKDGSEAPASLRDRVAV